MAAWHLDVPQGEKPFVFFDAFRNSSEQHPLQTPSGKIELYSDTIARYEYEDFVPHPEWRPPVEWLDAETAERWPLHFISIQPSDRLHSQLAVTPQVAANKTAGKETLYMHPQDAKARGIIGEQQVEVFNARVCIYAGVHMTEGVAPGVVFMSTGAWFEQGLGQKEWNAVEQSGNANVLTLNIGTSPLTQGPNVMSCLVDVAAA